MSTVSLERLGSVGVVRLDRPGRGNALSGATPAEIRAAIEEFGSDPDVSGVVITGTGRLFCAGGDLQTLLEWRDLDLDGRAANYRASQEAIHAMKACQVPVVAAVNGPAAGAGVDLALAADLRVASSKASFTAAFAGVGLVPDLGGSWSLTRTVGIAKALRFLLSGDRIGAEDALEMGLVDQVVEPDDLMAVACTAIDAITGGVPRAVVTETLAAVRGALHQDLTTSMELAAHAQARLMSSREHQERIAAFMSAAR